MAALVREHRTTLVFVNTRKMAERIAAQPRPAARRGRGREPPREPLAGAPARRRGAAQGRQAAGARRDRVARARHRHRRRRPRRSRSARRARSRRSSSASAARATRFDRVPKGRLFPLTLDELVEARRAPARIRDAASSTAPRTPPRPLDILAQQIVAACVAEAWGEDELFERVRPRVAVPRPRARATSTRWSRCTPTGAQRAAPPRRREPAAAWRRKRARITALTSGGAIPDTADYQVRARARGHLVGTLNEDFAIESNGGDIFQLGNASWRILRVEPGVVRVADAKGAAADDPVLARRGARPHARARRRDRRRARERARRTGRGADSLRGVRARCPRRRRARSPSTSRTGNGRRSAPCPRSAASSSSASSTRAAACSSCVHAPFGGRDQPRVGPRAAQAVLPSASASSCRRRRTRRRSCSRSATAAQLPARGGLRLPAPERRRATCSIQALLAAPMFETRWRWNASRVAAAASGRGTASACRRRSCACARTTCSPRPSPRSLACPETLPGGPIAVPMDHPIVRQTIEDCLTEAMDVDGLPRGAARHCATARIEQRAVDTPEPSAFARGILNAQPYAFLDDAPLEERRTQAVISRRVLDARTADELGALDPDAVARVREEAWPQPENAEEVHEALLWMGYVDGGRGGGRGSRGSRSCGAAAASCSRAAAGSRPRRRAIRRRCCAGGSRRSGPVVSDDPLLLELEARGRRAARAHRRAGGVVRPAAARAHPPLHARPAAQARSSRSRRRSSCGSSPAGSTSTPSTASTGRAASPRWSRSSRASRCPRRRGRRASCRRACAATGASGSTSSTLSGEVAWGAALGRAARRRSGRRRSASLPREDLDAWLRLVAAAGQVARASGAAARGPARGAHRARRDVPPGARARDRAACRVELEAGLAS